MFDAYRGPFIDLATGLPLSADAVFPTSHFAVSILTDRHFMNECDRNLDLLADKPVVFVFGAADPAHGALVCDDDPANPCPTGTTCTALPQGSLCLDGNGEVNAVDIQLLPPAFGPCSGNCPEDLDGNGVVEPEDLRLLISLVIP